MRTMTLVLLVVVAGCKDETSSGADTGAVAALDLANVTSSADGGIADLAGAGDQAASSADLAEQLDLLPGTDLVALPDLTALPDLVYGPIYLATTAGGHKFWKVKVVENGKVLEENPGVCAKVGLVVGCPYDCLADKYRGGCKYTDETCANNGNPMDKLRAALGCQDCECGPLHLVTQFMGVNAGGACQIVVGDKNRGANCCTKYPAFVAWTLCTSP